MISLNFIQVEDGWFESQPIQVSGNIAINLTFGDTNDNRIVLLKSSTGNSYVSFKENLNVGSCCDMNENYLIPGQYIKVRVNKLPATSSLLEDLQGSFASKQDLFVESGRAQVEESKLEQSINSVKQALDTLVKGVDATTAIDTFKEIEDFLSGVTNEKTLTGMLAVVDGKAATAQTTADSAKITASSALAKATENGTKLSTIPDMPANDGKIYGFCNGAWIVIAESGKSIYTS